MPTSKFRKWRLGQPGSRQAFRRGGFWDRRQRIEPGRELPARWTRAVTYSREQAQGLKTPPEHAVVNEAGKPAEPVFRKDNRFGSRDVARSTCGRGVP